MKKNLLLLFIFPILVFSQQNQIKKAEEKFKDEHYIESIKLFENLIDKGVLTAPIYEKLANANYLNANYVEANKWYTKLYELAPEMETENHYRYAQTLKSVGLFAESKIQLNIFESKRPNEIRTNFNKFDSSGKSMLTFSNIKLLSINSKYSDYGTAIKGDTLVFASARNHVLDNKTFARKAQPYTSLYQSIKMASGEYSTAKLFSKGSYSIYHEASPVFTKDGKTMYYGKNYFLKNSKTNLVNGLFKIYKSVYVNGKWKNKKVVSFNESDSIRIANPALSPDGKYLYFTADFEESYGNSDLFKVALNSDGTFGKTEHLSNKINTEGRETFPFITQDNTLIFASDGHKGLGGLDLFSYDLLDPNALAINLGNTVNSPFDDFALTINSEMNEGFYTSNRPEGMGDDDIYSFDLAIKPILFTGTITDEETNETVPNVSITVLDPQGTVIATMKSDINGSFIFNNFKKDSNYTFKFTKDNYLVAEKKHQLYKKDINETVTIKKEIKQIEAEIDLSNLLDLNIIYFDTDKSLIRQNAKKELDKIVEIMNQYPQIKLEIGSHTDSRESKSYNMNLSQRRADSTLNYLVAKGIEKSRLTAKGYGESQPVINCNGPIKCSNTEYQKNRRSTFIVKR
ncbi:OmpA family protein [Flavobacterium sp. W22_SRS_FP1]|uniref:OmpA family protein n=1 Tax=Flavobacterium sp. W22_SRS_FP1 TaxID=3240276 RepID=UPI003F8DB57D